MDTPTPAPDFAELSAISSTLNITPADLRPVDANQLRIAQRTGNPNDSMPLMVIDKGGTESLMTIENSFATPFRKRGIAKLENPDDFIEFVSRAKSDHTQLFYRATQENAEFTAVFNAHGSGAVPDTGWHDHSATYETKFSEEWLRWRNTNNQKFTQAEFAEMIELRRKDVVAPDAATMLKLAETMQASKSAKFEGAVRQQNGDQKLAFELTSSAKAGEKGEITVPDRFTIGIPVFVDDTRYQVEAYFRYRISDAGALSISYQLINTELTLDHAIKQIKTKIADGTELYAFRGIPIKAPL